MKWEFGVCWSWDGVGNLGLGRGSDAKIESKP